MSLSDEVRHAALAPLEAVWASFPLGNDDEPSAEVAQAAIAAAHEGIIAALLLVAEAIDRLEGELQTQSRSGSRPVGTSPTVHVDH